MRKSGALLTKEQLDATTTKLVSIEGIFRTELSKTQLKMLFDYEDIEDAFANGFKVVWDTVAFDSDGVSYVVLTITNTSSVSAYYMIPLSPLMIGYAVSSLVNQRFKQIGQEQREKTKKVWRPE